MNSPDETQLPERPKYRVPVGMPLRGEHRREGAVVSLLVHLVIITLLLVPIVLSHTVIQRMEQGAGGAGPAGGGGGGRGGASRGEETVRYVHVAPAAKTPTPAVTPTPTPVPPVPKPEVPKVPPPQISPPVQQTPDQASIAAPMQTVASVAGAGAGTGRDGTNGNGPGSGGGVGSGTGTGRGSGVGPGTGGGLQANYPPQPIEFFLPPLPPPASVRGFQFIAEFDVDSTGKVLTMEFTHTSDGGYNRRLESVLRSMKFRAGTRPDGTPIRMKAQVGYAF